MARRARKKRHSQEPVSLEDIHVFSGTVRSPEEAVGIHVELTIAGEQVTMSTEGEELGSWLITSIAVRSLGSALFEFIAEGDVLIFEPEDSTGFHTSPVFAPRSVEDDGRKRRKSRRKSSKAEKSQASESPHKSKTRRGRKQSAVAEDVASKPPKPEDNAEAPAQTADAALESDSESDAAVLVTEPAQDKREADAPTVDSETAPTDVEMTVVPAEEFAVTDDAGSNDTDDLARHEESEAVASATQQEDDRESPAPTVSEEPTAPEEAIEPNTEVLAWEEESNGHQDQRRGPWLSFIDWNRMQGRFHFDRVQVDENLRGQDHQHTWDHRVATGSGVSNHVCTICGKIRLSTKPRKPTRSSH